MGTPVFIQRTPDSSPNLDLSSAEIFFVSSESLSWPRNTSALCGLWSCMPAAAAAQLFDGRLLRPYNYQCRLFPFVLSTYVCYTSCMYLRFYPSIRTRRTCDAHGSTPFRLNPSITYFLITWASLVEQQVYKIPNLILIPTMLYRFLILFILIAITKMRLCRYSERLAG